MKTTIEIADSLLEWARTEAAERGVTLRAVVEEALRAALEAKQAAGRRPFKLGKSHFEGRGLQPGVTLGDWELVRSLIYEGRGG